MRNALHRLRQLHQQATTPGPFYAVKNDLVGGWMVSNVDAPASAVESRDAAVTADLTWQEEAELIAAARNALPHLLAIAEAAQDALGWLPRGGSSEGVADRLEEALARLNT